MAASPAPDDWADVYRRLVLRELAFDFRVGLGSPRGEASLQLLIRAHDGFEAAHVAWSAAAARPFDATIGVLAGRLPHPVRPLVRPITAILLDDPRTCAALGLRPPPAAFARLVLAALRLRGRLARPLREDAFRPGRNGRAVYPDGYALEDLGPGRSPRG